MNGIIELIKRKCSNEIYTTIEHQEYDNVYISIDIKHTFTIPQILDYLTKIIPTKLLFISIEGVVPLALLKSRKHKQMKEININELINKIQEQYPSIEILLSSQQVAGTANQKILDFIRKQRECLDYPIDSTHCFISNEYPFQFFSLHLSRSVLCIPNQHIMFDIVPTVISLLKSYEIRLGEMTIGNTIDDIVVLSTIIENDVIPSFTEITIESLLIEYKRRNEIIGLNGSINLPKLLSLINDANEYALRENERKEKEQLRKQFNYNRAKITKLTENGKRKAEN